jgi:hypothetical protein
MINFWPLLVAMIATHLIAVAIGYCLEYFRSSKDLELAQKDFQKLWAVYSRVCDERQELRARLETLTDRDARGRFVKREK